MNAARLLLALAALVGAAAGVSFATSSPAEPATGAGPSSRPARPPEFVTGILPVLTKAGCNAGACHGAATGQGGMKLSLLGYDPPADFQAITREFAGRRIDLSEPADSLLLRKATRAVRHKGGMRIDDDSDDYRTLADWIAAGVPYGRRDVRVVGVEARPDDVLLAREGDAVQLRVTATLSDGAREDVTRHALFGSNDDGTADVDAGGLVTVRRRGQTAVVVRYGGQVAAVRVAAPLRGEPVDPAGFEPNNFIDELARAEFVRLRVPPSPPCDDAEFLRRATLDLTGRLPTPAAVRSFLKEPATVARRRQVVRELTATGGFVDVWSLWLSDLLQIDSGRLGLPAARAYHAWVREQVARNTPYDQLVQALVTAGGDGSRVGPANFLRLADDPRDLAEFVGGTFLGAQIACARCHAHPLAAWTRDDYHAFAAFFARTGREGAVVFGRPRGEVQHPDTGRDLPPKFLGGGPYVPHLPDGDRRNILAHWLTDPRNPAFARAAVNRVWKRMLGRGLVEPADDLRPTNPPTNPTLLDALAEAFVADGYDLRKLIETIAESRTYQLSSRATPDNAADDRLYSHATPRPLPAQVLVDAVAQATGVPDEYPGYPAGTPAVRLVDARVPAPALDVLGRCTRDANCDARPRGGGLAAALHLMNGATINGKLRGGVIDDLLKAGSGDADIVEELYLRSLSRLPEDRERAHWADVFAEAGRDADRRRELAEDLLWALLNSREFVYNH